MRLKNRIAIVTGGSSGIGRGISIEFAREGAKMVIADIQENPRRGRYHETDVRTTTVEEIDKLSAEGIFVRTDVVREADLQRLIQRTVDHFGGLDILVNNAGISAQGTSQETSLDDWDRVMAVNLRAAFAATKIAIPHLRNSTHGRIIHVASIAAYFGGAGPSYSATKAGLVNLARDAALELGEYGITTNVICPGYIETALQDYQTPDQIEHNRQQIPLPRLGTPHDIGRAAVFLGSDDAAWITGIALVVDGGHICRL